MTEPILDEANGRFTMYPITYMGLWELYQKQLSSFWKPQEIDFSKDYEDFIELNKDEQYFIKCVLAFFASSDGIVNFNLSKNSRGYHVLYIPDDDGEYPLGVLFHHVG